MDLPVMPPVAPMLATAVRQIPDTGHVEPKWDGFRAIVFRDGPEVVLTSRNARPMTRYFPEVVAALLDNLPPRCVLDGEVVLARQDRLDFEALQLRLHPASSRVHLLADQSPASFVAFDLLALGDADLTGRPFGERRRILTDILAAARGRVHVTPATGDPVVARRWFGQFEGAGLDGVVAKSLDGGYQPGRRVMFKVKHQRTLDCVVAGLRWHASGPVVGSLLLGLYSAEGSLQHVGVCASFTAERRRALLTELAAYRFADDVAGTAHPWAAWAAWSAPALEAGADAPEPRRGGAGSRWSPGKDLSWVPLRPELVAEVSYDHLEGRRLRHTAQFRCWRPDRDPRSCGYDQVETPAGYDLSAILGRAP